MIYRKNHVRVSLINKINGEQWADSGEPSDYKIPAYNLTNFIVGYDFGRVKLQAGVYNLFDNRSITDIKVNTGTGLYDPNSYDQVWWLPERNYQITMRITLD